MELLFGLIGSLWFWVSFCLFWLVVYAVHEDEFWPPLIGVIVGFFALHWWSSLPVMTFVKENYLTIFQYTFAYLGIGIVWSFVKWYFFLVGKKEEYNEIRRKFLERTKIKDLTEWTDEIRDAWAAELKYKNFPPKASDNKSRITTWMIYWVFSAVGTVFGTFLTDIFNHIYNLFGNLYDKLSRFVFRDIGKEFERGK